MSGGQGKSSNGTKALLVLTLGALGVVYGDIGTSPLYAMKEAFHELEPTRDNVYGIMSLMFWSMTYLVSFKYVVCSLRVHYNGEGGITALISLVKKHVNYRWIIFGIFGVNLLYGDGAITPAISVLSAVEGLSVVTQKMDPYVIPIACVILIGLFMIQKRGTTWVGKFFGPVMVTWFALIGTVGLMWLSTDWSVLEALNPWYGIKFFVDQFQTALFSLTVVILVVTGGEALYADMGHYGPQPIRFGWLFVFPALILNYLGQAALIIHNPEAAHQPFFNMVPSWFLLPTVVLATLATIIASQALISGAFSLTKSLEKLYVVPEWKIVSTSNEHSGQIYVPVVNWALMIACLALVITFRSSSGLAGAYGIAVNGTMFITSGLLYYALVHRHGWRKLHAGLLVGSFLIVEGVFLIANSTKLFHGGWISITIAIILTYAMEKYFYSKEKKRNARKQPITYRPHTCNKRIAVIGVSEYVWNGTFKTIGDARNLYGFGENILLVHFTGNDEYSRKRAAMVQDVLEEAGERIHITEEPSGDLSKAMIHYLQDLQCSLGAEICVFLGETVERKDRSPHPTANVLADEIKRAGYCCTIVPYIEETAIVESEQSEVVLQPAMLPVAAD